MTDEGAKYHKTAVWRLLQHSTYKHFYYIVNEESRYSVSRRILFLLKNEPKFTFEFSTSLFGCRLNICIPFICVKGWTNIILSYRLFDKSSSGSKNITFKKSLRINITRFKFFHVLVPLVHLVACVLNTKTTFCFIFRFRRVKMCRKFDTAKNSIGLPLRSD